jgi:predicted regulator of Ras-like GTPase activity (Roadblock/LC7/MglB family)
MFGALKKLFSKQPAPSKPQIPPPAPSKPETRPPAKPAASVPKATAPPVAPAPKPSAPASSVQAAPKPPTVPRPVPQGEMVSISLKSVFATLSSECASLIKRDQDGNISLPASLISEQLSKGAVRITFGELRSLAPEDTFYDNSSQDDVLVSLPLAEILSRVSPTLLKRKPQKRIEASSDISNLFGAKGEALTAIRAAASGPSAAARPVTPAPTPAAPPAAPVPPAPPRATPAYQPSAPVTAQVPEPKAAPLPEPAASRVEKPIAFAPPPSPPAASPVSISGAKLPPPPGKVESAPVSPTAPASESRIAFPSVQKPGSTGAPAAAAAKSSVAPSAAPEVENGALLIPVSEISALWPETVLGEIANLGLSNARVGFPLQRLEVILKTGRIIFTWRQIGDWLKPQPLPLGSAHEDVPLEIPLSLIAPRFIAARKPAQPAKKVVVGTNIPDLFVGKQFVPPAASAPAAAAPAPAPAPAEPPPSISPAPSISMPSMSPVEAKPAPVSAPAVLGEVFGRPEKKNWSPHEIVAGTTTLKGVAGAMISIREGLLVAALLPAPLKAETVAAFLPQIINRTNQYAKEAQMGELTALLLTFSGTPWQIFLIETVYFAVIGKPGEALPVSQLTQIATELGRQKPN